MNSVVLKNSFRGLLYLNFNKEFVINENINRNSFKVYRTRDRRSSHRSPPSSRMSELFVYGLTSKEAIEAEFGRHGEVTGVVTTPGRKAK